MEYPPSSCRVNVFGAMFRHKSQSMQVLPDQFGRELIVVMRRHRKKPKHLSEFVQNILFG
jgi:hypothetical protein